MTGIITTSFYLFLCFSTKDSETAIHRLELAFNDGNALLQIAVLGFPFLSTPTLPMLNFLME